MLILFAIISAAVAMVVHELGHFIVARRFKVTASELAFGLGPIMTGFNLGHVRINFRAFPVGSFVRIDRTALEDRSVQQQLLIHLGGIILNLIVGLLAYGTVFGWMNLVLAAGNLLPLYQHDGWKCGVVLVRALMQRRSQPVERAFTYSGGFLSLVIAFVIIKSFI